MGGGERYASARRVGESIVSEIRLNRRRRLPLFVYRVRVVNEY